MSSNQGNKFRVVGGVEGGGSASSARTDGAGLKPLSIDELFDHMRSLRLQMLNRELEECQAHQRLLWASYNEHCKKEFRLMSSINAIEGVQPDLFGAAL